MALLQIAEPGQSAAPHEHKIAVGIDLGTTNSLVAAVRSGQAEVLVHNDGSVLMPSVVYFGSDETLVGKAAQAQALQEPLNTIASAKRLIGRGLGDVKSFANQLPYEFANTDSGMPLIITSNGNKSPVEVSAEVLKPLRQLAEATLAQGSAEISGAVITVPAYFDEAQRQATKHAATLAGINVLRLLNEPTAAAVAYGLDVAADGGEAQGIHAIYDLGGGTFDISILRLNKGVYEVLATGGDSALGGDDFDQALAAYFWQQLGEPRLTAAQHRYLQETAKSVKEQLSDNAEVSVHLSEKDLSWEGVFTRGQLESLLQPLVKNTLTACQQALDDAGIEHIDVDAVVMVGGSTRVPLVQLSVSDFFGVPVHADIDPDQVVAIGAAIQANILVGNAGDGDSPLLLDVIPLSLGIETYGGLVEKIIPRNTAIPVAKAQEFTTFKDGQNALAIHVLQGEREIVDDCRSLARFELRGIPARVAGAARIQITFQVDADGLLSVSARELETGIQTQVQVKPSFGLSAEEMHEMLQTSFTHAAEDRDARMFREELVEAERAIEAIDSALFSDAHLLTNDETEQLTLAMTTVKLASKQKDIDAMRQAMKQLSQASDSFAEKRMNHGIQQALKGQDVEKVTIDTLSDPLSETGERNSCLK